ncbi:MAG: NTP transferase domain-containing protein [Chloroflexi bacterium]|nr:NTP transferase domain-containing protein [Chloroflexota bacterium]
MVQNESLYAAVLAGGGGTRLWPRSRQRLPKHLLSLVGEMPLLNQTLERIRPLVAPERTFVVTVADHADLVREQVSTLPSQNIIVEPEGHGTAPCIGLAALHIHRRNPEATMISLHADHTIADAENFRRILTATIPIAQQGYLVTLGIKPSYPETGYGYIQQGEHIANVDGHPIYRVERFTEKPRLEIAREFLRRGNYYWNSGIFVWKVSTILEQMSLLLPDLYAQLMEIQAVLGTPQEDDVLRSTWQKVRDMTIDVGIMERAADVAVIPAAIQWNDVGSWSSLAELLPNDAQGNVIQGEHIGLDTENCLIYGSERLIATIGLHNLIIVDAGDVLLICPKERAQDVKRIVDQLKATGKEEYL